jgi:signal transduction histidine kinase
LPCDERHGNLRSDQCIGKREAILTTEVHVQQGGVEHGSIGDLQCGGDGISSACHLALELGEPVADEHCNQGLVLYNKYPASSVHRLVWLLFMGLGIFGSTICLIPERYVQVANSFRGLIGLIAPASGDLYGKRLLILSRSSYVLLLLGALGAVFLAFKAADVQNWVQHSIDVRGEARQLVASVQDAIIRERGLLLTGDDRYLGDFQLHLQSVTQRFNALRASIVDNPEQTLRLGPLEQPLHALANTLEETVSFARAGRQEEAIEVVRSNRVLGLSTEISEGIKQFIDAEQRLLDKRQAEARWLQQLLLILIAGGLVIATAMSFVLERATRHFIGNLQDRTAELESEIKRRHETEETLRQAHKMEAVGQLTGGIAHDFNNLLTIIIGNLDTLKRHLGKLSPDLSPADVAAIVSRQVDVAMQAARNAAKLTHRLLAFARRQPLEPKPLDCNRLVSGMSELLRRTLGEVVDMEVVLGGGLWSTFADPNQLENAMLNLALNARHAMPNGGRLTIETTNAYLDEAYVRRFGDLHAGQYVQISVADTGAGIPADVLDRVFEPFFTTKGAEAGSGLGLAMVHGFVKQTGGHVRIYSEVGHGTTVKIYLPRLHEAEVVAAYPAPTAENVSPVAGARPDETILLVEDNEGVREYAREVLQELGYKIIEAGNAADATRLVADGARIDLLFTDVVLPGGVSGRELSDRLLKLRPNLLVLFTTGYTRNAIVHHGRLDPGVHLLNKPYTQQDLVRKVRELLDRRKPTA